MKRQAERLAVSIKAILLAIYSELYQIYAKLC